jgi:hypothetical protein
MRAGGGRTVRAVHADTRALAGALLAVATFSVLLASPASASLGYQLDATHPSRALPGPPKGLAVDQASQDIYVAIVSTDPNTGTFGEVDRFNSNLTADGVFAPGGGYYTGVAPDPITGGFFAAQMEIKGTPIGNVGTPRLDKFTSAGASAGSFALGYSNSFPPIVADSAGHIYVPNVNTHSVQVFSSTGTLLQEITCSGCPGGSFGKPGSVALDSGGNLYVADTAPDRVVKLILSEGAYVFGSLVQSGRGAGAVAVDPSTGDILVGDMPGGDNYHIVAYDSSGTQFDDFGAGLFRNASSGGYGALSAYQIAVNGTTHKLYVGEYDKFYVFERANIGPPTVVAKAATSVGQLGATLNATVNANGHAVLECEFTYTDEADFQANGFSNGTSVPCPKLPNGSANTAMSVHAPGLSPETAYRYRIKATSYGGSANSSQTFQTLPAVPPTVTPEAAQEVSQTAATLKGAVNPHGGEASDCHFEWGASTSYGANLPCATLPGPVTTDVAESKPISGLTQGTAYHYRLVVTTNAGTTEGDDVEFVTASPPTSSQPSSPPSASPEPTGPTIVPPLPPCKPGFRRRTVAGQSRCVKVCKKGFRKQRVRGKVTCVRRKQTSRRRQQQRHARTVGSA